MELDVNGTIVAQPGADDIVRALGAASFPEDWYIALDDQAGRTLDAQAQADGTFRLSYGNDKQRPPQTVDAATVKAVYLEFLAGRAGAQHDGPTHAAPHLKFVPDKRPLLGRKGDQPPVLAIVAMIVIVAVVWSPFAIERWSPGTVVQYIPYAKHDLFWIGLIFFPMVALLLVASVTKIIQFRAAKNWVQTTGRILSAGIETRRHQFQDEPETVKNVPAVKYEFKVGARTVDGTRISIGDEGGLDIEATLKRYPAGAAVTVYYDPRDPTQCVLERDLTQDLKDHGLTKRDVLSGCVGGLAMLAVLGMAIWGLAAYGPDFVRAHFPRLHSHAEMPVALVGFGLVMLMFFFAARRAAKQAATWPVVRGKIVKSEVEEFQERNEDSDGRTRWRTAYRPAVEYAYVANGRELRGNQISYGMTVSAGKGYAEKVAAKFPIGGEIDVHYDPKEPSNSALTAGGAGVTWIIFVAALAVFALAAALLGVFG
jgi:Protein of unknown function (DUF3592)